jgi:hypothetical protein
MRMRNHPLKALLFLIPFGFASLCWQGESSGQEEEGRPWETIETKYTVIHYPNQADLRKINNSIHYGPTRWSISRWKASQPGDEMQERLGAKVDRLFERVQEILDMRTRMGRIVIKIFPDKEALYEAYEEVYKKPAKVRAWYTYEYNTIYLSVPDLHEGMLAHEMAHAVIDHYFQVRPPAATAEILARYVDSHLKR